MKTADKLGFIFFPGPKAIAYLSILKKLKIAPAVIIVMKNEHAIPAPNSLTTEYIKNSFFDLNESITQFALHTPSKIIISDATHINDPTLSQELDNQALDTWLFSGGGIIKAALLKKNCRFLHIHPGQLPEVKGSTCFYYSLLINQSLAASAFFMQESLDTGDTLASSQFRVNLGKELLTPAFLDNIIDPWIRAQVLQKLLLNWYSKSKEKLINRTSLPSCRAYYVAHPMLRALAILKTTKHYDAKAEQGVFEIEE
jgi:methionyl-tRNA formyltransferase